MNRGLTALQEMALKNLSSRGEASSTADVRQDESLSSTPGIVGNNRGCSRVDDDCGSSVPPAQSSSQKEAARKKRWQQKNKKKLADYQKEYRAKNK